MMAESNAPTFCASRRLQSTMTTALSTRTIQPGRYRHYKGKEYEVFFVATHSETLEKLVVYRTLYGDFSHWVRPLDMFLEFVTIDGKDVPRFQYIGEMESQTGDWNISEINPSDNQ